MKTTSFSLSKLLRLRERAAKAAQTPIDRPKRWSKSTVDPMKVLAVYKTCPWIKKAFVLRAYSFREDGKSDGILWAMPADADFPESRECPRLRSKSNWTPKPLGASGDLRNVIDGDGSPWSYLCASLLTRELDSFGKLSRRVWDTHTILAVHPWEGRKQNVDLGDTAAWTWHLPEPKEWRPSVTEDGDKITVTFYAYSGHIRDHICRHRDTYRRGSYCYKSRVKDIATGTGGFEFDEE
jgi:hypothetical protein